VSAVAERRLASLRAFLMQEDAELRTQLPEYFLTYYNYLRILRNPPRIEHLFQKAREMHRHLEGRADVSSGRLRDRGRSWWRSTARAT
jgi:hypothetical protein